MSEGEDRAQRTVEVAEAVSDVLDRLGARSALIGAAALAAHNYPRDTADLDLATYEDPFTLLRDAERQLSAAGHECDLRLPDDEDPLGGVLTVRGEGHDPVQVVNFRNPLGGRRNPGRDAVASATPLPGTRLRVVDLPHLVALKLYAGGPKSRADVVELLERNPDVPVDVIRTVCAANRLDRAFDAIVAALHAPPDDEP